MSACCPPTGFAMVPRPPLAIPDHIQPRDGSALTSVTMSWVAA